MADRQVDQDSAITQLCSITGCSAQDARELLATNEWNLEAAAAEYYASQEDEDEEAEDPSVQQGGSQSQSLPRGGRTLGGGPAPALAVPAASSSSSSRSASRSKPSTTGSRKFATLRDLTGGDQGGHRGGDDDSDDDENQDLFAGGEKSGLAVQNPGDTKDQVKALIDRAKRGVPRPGGEDAPASSSHFRGSARTLGGDDAPSRLIEDPNAHVPRRQPTVRRTLHLWRDGYSVDDGALYRFDDPNNAEHLALINQGRAPLEIMNVEIGQPVDVQMQPHDENYVAPKKKFVPFSGGGQRLGSPTPGVPAPRETVQTSTTSSTSQASSGASSVNVDESQPIISLQIRLGDGARLVSRFNTTHTIEDVYDFVNASSPTSRSRPWVLMTTFPSKELTDKRAKLGDLAEFKRGGVVVQKWL